jgi:hypothetical protein
MKKWTNEKGGIELVNNSTVYSEAQNVGFGKNRSASCRSN